MGSKLVPRWPSNGSNNMLNNMSYINATMRNEIIKHVLFEENYLISKWMKLQKLKRKWGSGSELQRITYSNSLEDVLS